MAAGCSPRSTGRAAGSPGPPPPHGRRPLPRSRPLAGAAVALATAAPSPAPRPARPRRRPGKSRVGPACAALRGATAPLSGAEGSPASCLLEEVVSALRGPRGKPFYLGFILLCEIIDSNCPLADVELVPQRLYLWYLAHSHSNASQLQMLGCGLRVCPSKPQSWEKQQMPTCTRTAPPSQPQCSIKKEQSKIKKQSPLGQILVLQKSQTFFFFFFFMTIF